MVLSSTGEVETSGELGALVKNGAVIGRDWERCQNCAQDNCLFGLIYAPFSDSLLRHRHFFADALLVIIMVC